ncbi:hypothetical protein BsWGS_18798 [Bradybaena similaris]
MPNNPFNYLVGI